MPCGGLICRLGRCGNATMQPPNSGACKHKLIFPSSTRACRWSSSGSAELRQQQIAAAQLENRAVLEARAAIQRYERARRLVEQSRGEFAQSIPEALKPFEDQFKAGQITLLQVFAARATLVQSRQSFLDLLNELALAAADVTQATGLPPQQLMADVEPLPVPLEEVPQP